MNFIFFMPDEMQAEAAACYGHPLIQTPALDRLAGEGTRFDACYTQHPVCTPSRCSMFTGWYPHVRGHRTLWHLLRPDEPNMLRDLRAGGYDVRWYGKNDLLAEASFADSVDEALPHGSPNVGPLLRDGPDDPFYDSFLSEPFPQKPEDTGDARCVQKGIDFLRGPHDKPFFLYLPLGYPHPEYSAPQPFHDMYRPEDVPDLRSPEGADRPMFQHLIRQYRKLDRLGDGDFRRINAIYLGMCSYVDWMVGRVMDALEDTGLVEDTCLIFTTDHGDWAGHYGLVEKWPSAMDDTITRIPLIIRLPKGARSRAEGHVVDTPVELFDVMPTIMELAGLDVGHTHFAKSLVPQLHGAAGDADRIAVCEGGYGAHEPHCFEGRNAGPQAGRNEEMIYYQKGKLQQDHPVSVCRTTMLRSADHKFVYRTDDICELYNMKDDPREEQNLIHDPRHADLRRGMEERLLAFYHETADVTPADEDPRGLPKGGFRQNN